ncbi:MAG: M48 family metallopeptidase [Saprospiraceae bacterium]|nr:M48 family metallopeptidase [Saprospiraceae bacterium]
MAKRKMQIDIEGVPLLVNVFVERRKGRRVSIGHKHINIRIPQSISKAQQAEELQESIDWIRKTIQRKPDILNRFRTEDQYLDGDELRIKGQKFVLRLEESDRKTSKAKLQGDTIYMDLSDQLKGAERVRVIKRLISRVMAGHFGEAVKARVHVLNKRFFRQSIERIYLKYNSSNWGSCSSKRNINLSTRLLLAPDEVMDYVIIHELAHLIEMNHSARFWKLVADAMPDYKQHVAWLHEYGHQCDF